MTTSAATTRSQILDPTSKTRHSPKRRSSGSSSAWDAPARRRFVVPPAHAEVLCRRRRTGRRHSSVPGDDIEQMMYGRSVLHCLPASRTEEPSAALGTVLRASTMERLFNNAGFSRIEMLSIENDFFRCYRLIP